MNAPSHEATSGIAQSVAKLLDARRNGRISVDKCAEQIARHLDASHDPAAAGLVREALARGKVVEPRAAWQSLGAAQGATVVDWKEPQDLSDQLVLDEALGAVLARLAAELAQAPRILACGIDAPTRALFHGPSGTGKTLAALWLGGRLGMPVALVRLDRTTDSYMGATARNLAKAMEAVEACPSILFLDEIDGLCADRAAKQDVEEQGRITSALFQQLDALPPAQIVVAATNFRNKVDPALIRRLPCEVAFGLPSTAAREAMIRRWWRKVDYEPTALFATVGNTNGRSGAETRALAMAVARAALLGGGPITLAHVDRAVAERRAA